MVSLIRTSPHLRRVRDLSLVLGGMLGILPFAHSAEPKPDAAPLPAGVRAVWDLPLAHRESTPTRERVCLNGLWRWQPTTASDLQVPSGQWGYFKVPGSWPGITDYMQKDSQTVFAHPAWSNRALSSVSAAWYERELTVPTNWSQRRIVLRLDYLNSFATVFVDGVRAGEVRFPGGDVDLTSACLPGRTHRLSLLVVALPLKGVMLSYGDSASAREIKGSVARRGLCGDVFLESTPTGARVSGVQIDTSVRRKELTLGVELSDLRADARYVFRAHVTQPGGATHAFRSEPFERADLTQSRFTLRTSWLPQRLWDIDTPSNTCALELTLASADGDALDLYWTERFGFREFWIQGRDFYLNGTRLFLSAIPLDNAQIGAASANYAATRESLERLQSIGINFVYGHNYSCEPGTHLSFAEILRAADDTGMLVALSQPHFSHYEWPSAEADQTNGYARHAAFYVGAARNHPSVVMYSMSHNATGYNEDMNPDMIDGRQDARDSWALRNVKMAQRAEAIVQSLDSGRIVYHHASGNLGPMHPVNFYPNFVPIQELTDWFEHWATQGIKPAFLCEYGAPFTWDWTMYRGWYKGEREFGSARVPWEFCVAEWNAQFLGDRAFPASEAEKNNLRWEARQFRAGNLWHRWDYPTDVGSTRLEERYPVFAAYLTDNWRAFRTWGVSAISPWEHGHFWKLRPGVDRRRRDLVVDWEHLQRPGFSPDYIDQRYERVDLAFERSDWIETPAAQALVRHNRPLLAYIAGKVSAVTSKDHLFLPGETVEKQVVIINNSRAAVACEVDWSCTLQGSLPGSSRVSVGAGDQVRIPLALKLAAGSRQGRYELQAKARFNTGEVQTDTFAFQLLESPPPLALGARIAVWDPLGETMAWLNQVGVTYERVEATADLQRFDLLVVGKAAFSAHGPAPDISRVRDGLNVVMFEQSAEVLEKRFGFRIAEYGLRQIFPRIPDHPVIAGLDEDALRDWRGEATLASPRLKYQMRPRHGPTVQWCDLPVTRLWRCGNRGNVASVLIEKPARGDFQPLLDGGYSLQYSPLLEYHEGAGTIVFCQLDVTGRTEPEPTADRIARSLLRYLATRETASPRKLVYAGERAGLDYLQSLGLHPEAFSPTLTPVRRMLLLGPGAGAQLDHADEAVRRWSSDGGAILGVGLPQADLDRLELAAVKTKEAEHISTGFKAFNRESPFAGIGPADVHLRDPRQVPLIVGGATTVGDGVLAQCDRPQIAFFQLPPWQFDAAKSMNLKRTHRRLSFALNRLLANLGVVGATPLLERFHQPCRTDASEQRWLEGFYLDRPEEWDDPYRFFRW